MNILQKWPHFFTLVEEERQQLWILLNNYEHMFAETMNELLDIKFN